MEVLSELENELVEMIVDVCETDEPGPGEVSPHDPLIGPDSPLGLDSLDAVEIVVEIQNRFGVRIEAAQTARQVLVSLRVLAEYVESNRS